MRGRHPADLLEAVDELCLKLLHELGPGTRPRGSDWRPTRLTTRSVEASKSYVEALSRFARGGRAGAEEAEGLLDRALALDPSFAQAYVKKAEIQHWLRRWGYGDPDPVPAILAAARRLRDLPDRERLLVKSFEALVVRQQPSVAPQDWNALLQFYPTYSSDSCVPRRGETLVRLIKVSDPTPKSPDHCRGVVSRAVVDHHDLDVVIVLRKHALHSAARRSVRG